VKGVGIDWSHALLGFGFQGFGWGVEGKGVGFKPAVGSGG